jgi:predicted DNA-binding transcriptional regulator AlpA
MTADRGQIMLLRDVAKRGGMSESTLRRLMVAGNGPPALRRPGSNRWFFYSTEVDAWLESGRVKPAA